MKPSPEEIRFAQQRKKIQEVLEPYLMKRAEENASELLEGGARVARPTGHPLPDTLRDQELSTFVRFTTRAGNEYRIDIVIAHTEGWHPAVTVYASLGGPTPTIILYDDVDGGIAEVRDRIDSTFRRIRDEDNKT